MYIYTPNVGKYYQKHCNSCDTVEKLLRSPNCKILQRYIKSPAGVQEANPCDQSVFEIKSR